MSENRIILKRPGSHIKDLDNITDIDQLCTIARKFPSEHCIISFENAICKKDKEYFLSSLSALKKKQFTKVTNQYRNILASDPNYFWAYVVAGAACRNRKPYYDESIFYFSIAALLNPNCLNIWNCLLKHYRNHPYVQNIIFESVYSGTLRNERKFNTWCGLVTELLECSSGKLAPLRDPLKVLSPFLMQSDHEKKKFVSNAIADYLLRNSEWKYHISDLRIVSKALQINQVYNLHDFELAEKILNYTFSLKEPNCCLDFLDCILSCATMKGIVNNRTFLIKALNMIPLISLNSTNKFLKAFSKLRKKNHRMVKRDYRPFRIPCLWARWEFTKALRSFDHRKRKGRRTIVRYNRFTFKEMICLTWACIRLYNLPRAYFFLFKATKRLMTSAKRSNQKKISSDKKIASPMTRAKTRSVLYLWLYVLTHGSTLEMRKLGVLFCLKLLKKHNNAQLLFYCCIGLIGLGLNHKVTVFLKKLLNIGAINEVIFLKALLEDSFSTKMKYLNAISDLPDSYMLAAVDAYKYDTLKNAFNLIQKASERIPNCLILYEWLGLFFNELGDYEIAEKYFKAAINCNRFSWTSISLYSSLLFRRNKPACNTFLDKYRHRYINGYKYEHAHLVSYKAGMSYLQTRYNFKQRLEHTKGAQNFIFSLCLKPQSFNVRFLKELIGDSYSLSGKAWTSSRWFSECFIENKTRYFYAECQLAKQLFRLKRVNAYAKVMRIVIQKGGLNTFICLHTAAHAFYLKAARASLNNKHGISQVYCQQAMFLAARALTIFSNFACSWKLIGDILYKCGTSTYSFGYIYVPDWLCPEYADDSIVLLRRLESLQLAIRCYIKGIYTPKCSKRMKSCLWNSIAVAYIKAGALCSLESRKRCLYLAMDCCFQAFKINSADSHAWLTMGLLIEQLGNSNRDEKNKHVVLCLNTALKLENNRRIMITARANLGFKSLAMGKFDDAYMHFLFWRGRSTALDFPWIGQIFINLLTGTNMELTAKHILFLYTYTRHHPSITLLLFYLKILSHYYPKSMIRRLGKKYSKLVVHKISSFDDYFTSFYFNMAKKEFEDAKLDILYALRTANGLKENGIVEYSKVLYALRSFSSERLQSSILHTVHQNVKDLASIYSLCGLFSQKNRHDLEFMELLKALVTEEHPVNSRILNLALAYLCTENGAHQNAEYYFTKSNDMI